MKIKRRPSVEIAKSFVELNLKAVIDAEQEEKMSETERKAAQKRTKKSHKVRTASLAVLGIVIFAGVSAGVWWNTAIQPVNLLDKNYYQFEVASGSSTSQIATALKKAKFIRNELAFKIYARLSGNISQAGTFMLTPSDSLPKIAEKLTRAETDEINVQIGPGLTLKEMKVTFKDAGFTDNQIEKALNANYDSEILKNKPKNASFEGYLFPETYRVFASDDLETIIKKALDHMAQVVKENNLEAKFAAEGLTLHEGLTLASIVTKEVINEQDQRNAASVFLNRLRQNIMLGSDVTYQYAYNQGFCEKNTPECDSIYNTRKNNGIPPTPIANPTLSALLAVANAPKTDYLYFVTGDDGKTHFTKTEDEHNAAVAKYCDELCKY